MTTKKVDVERLLYEVSGSFQVEFGGRVQVYNCSGDFTHTLAALKAQDVADPEAELAQLCQEAMDRLALSNPPGCDCALAMAAIGLRPGTITHVQPLTAQRSIDDEKDLQPTFGFTIGAGQTVINR